MSRRKGRLCQRYSKVQQNALAIGVNVTHYTDGSSIISDSAGYTILDNVPAFTQKRMKTGDVDAYLQYHMERTKNGWRDLAPLNEPVAFLDFKIPE